MSQESTLYTNPDMLINMGLGLEQGSDGYTKAGSYVSHAILKTLGLEPSEDLRETNQQSELSILQQLARTGAEKLGTGVEVYELGSEEYVVTLGAPIDPEKPTHLVDFDDTLVATKEAKFKTKEAYQQHLGELDVANSAEVADIIMPAADLFSRWEEGGHMIQHLDAQFLATSWATRLLKLRMGLPSLDVAKYAATELAQITPFEGQSSGEGGPSFGMRDGQVTFNPTDGLVTEEMASVFSHILLPEPYKRTVRAYRKAQRSGAANTGIFSYGIPTQQFIKILARLVDDRTRRDGDHWQPNIIFFTKVAKGDYLQALADRVQDDESPLGQIAYQLFSSPCITMFDDDPGQLDSLGTWSEGRLGSTPVRTIRSIQRGTKNEHEKPEWDNGEVVDGRIPKYEKRLRRALGNVATTSA